MLAAGDALRAERCTWELLGRRVGVKCMARLLGHKTNYLYSALQPDLRQRLGCKIPRDSKMSAHVDAFMLTTYLSVGETLPDKCRPLPCLDGMK